MNNKEWTPHVVQQGEHLPRIAFRAGVTPEHIWQHPKNAELSAKRKNFNTLEPGDVLHVPKEPPPGLPLRKGGRQKYRADPPRVPVKLELRGRSLAGQPFEVRGLPAPLRGTVAPNGAVTFDVPVWVREVEVWLPERSLSIPVRVGDLDPIEARNGLVQRLQNLGHLDQGPGEVDDETLGEALASFQRDAGVPYTGQADAATLVKLEENHGT